MNIKRKIEQETLTIGTWLTIPSSAVAEILCQAGFEWISIDLEHSPITLSEAQEIIRVIDLYGCIPAVRVGENNPTIIKRVLDAGAKIIIVPMVNSKEDAIKAINAVKYPPEGTRGVGLARAQKYGFGFKEYKKWVQEESVIVAQIEHIDAINNLEEIISTDIDATFIGPYDLSGSLGEPGNFNSKEFKDAIEKYESVSRSFNKPMGFHIVEPNKELICDYIKKRYSFLAIGIDTIFLGQKVQEVMEEINEDKTKRD